MIRRPDGGTAGFLVLYAAVIVMCVSRALEPYDRVLGSI